MPETPQTRTVEVSASLECAREFETTYRKHVGYVLHSLRRLGVPERDVEDVAHDVFLVVARKLMTYDSALPMKPWLFGIAFRVALDYRRSARSQRESIGADAEPADPRAGAEHDLELREKQRLVLRALEAMGIDQRAVFVLHDIDETPVPEIALALGIPINTAYSRLRLAREQFAGTVRTLAKEER